MKQPVLSDRECEKIRQMKPEEILSYIRDIYCSGYEDAKKDMKMISVDLDQFRKKLLEVKGISRGKGMFVTELLRECMKEAGNVKDNEGQSNCI